MLLQIHNSRFRQVCCEHLRTNDQHFLQECFLEFLFFPKIMLESKGAAYTRVQLIHESLQYYFLYTFKNTYPLAISTCSFFPWQMAGLSLFVFIGEQLAIKRDFN